MQLTRVLNGVAVTGAGLAAWQTVRLLRLIHREMEDHRASFTYVAETSHAQEEHERKWTEARNPRVGQCRPAPSLSPNGQGRWNHFLVDWAGE
jgi:hypothetical protein